MKLSGEGYIRLAGIQVEENPKEETTVTGEKFEVYWEMELSKVKEPWSSG